MPQFTITLPRDVTRGEREALGAAGLEAAYIGSDLPVDDSIPVISVDAADAHQARERIVALLGLTKSEARRLVVLRRPTRHGDGQGDR